MADVLDQIKDHAELSHHLKSRHEVEAILEEGGIPSRLAVGWIGMDRD